LQEGWKSVEPEAKAEPNFSGFARQPMQLKIGGEVRRRKSSPKTKSHNFEKSAATRREFLPGALQWSE
jgi:hypothetical protein